MGALSIALGVTVVVTFVLLLRQLNILLFESKNRPAKQHERDKLVFFVLLIVLFVSFYGGMAALIFTFK